MFNKLLVNILIYASIVRYIFIQKYISLDELNKTILLIERCKEFIDVKINFLSLFSSPIFASIILFLFLSFIFYRNYIIFKKIEIKFSPKSFKDKLLSLNFHLP